MPNNSAFCLLSYLSDYIVLFLSSQNELLETILSNKNFNRMNILKDLSKVVTKTISNTYDILYELNNEEKKYHFKQIRFVV